MIESKLYFLEGKVYEPIIYEIENHPRKHTLKQSIAVYMVFEMHYAVITANELIETIVQKYGAKELRNDTLRFTLYTQPERYTLLYGEKELVKFIDPHI